MGDENYGLALSLELVHLVPALFLEGFSAHGEDLVYKHGVGVGVDSGGKSQPQVHAGGEVLELHVFEFPELGKLEDISYAVFCLKKKNKIGFYTIFRLLVIVDVRSI